MKKIIIYTFTVFIAVSCISEKVGSEEKFSDSAEFVNRVNCVIPRLESIDTKTSISIDGNFSWNKGDLLDFWPDTENTFSGTSTKVQFKAEGTGESTIFKGDGWGLVREMSYMSVYPHQDANTLSQVKLSYKNQSQEANADTKHLGTYDYLYSVTQIPSLSSGENVSIQFNRIGSYMHYHIAVPADSYTTKFKNFRISSEENLFMSEASCSLSKDGLNIDSANMEYTENIALSEIVPDNGYLDVCMMTYPVSWSGKEITFTLINEDDETYTATVTPTKNQVANKGYDYSISVVKDGGTDNDYVMCYFDCDTDETVTLLNLTDNVAAVYVDELSMPVAKTYDLTAGEHLIKIKMSGADIPANLFAGCQADSVYIPSSVTSLGYRAFANSCRLQVVKMPASLETFGAWPFFGCSSLREFRGPKAVEDGKFIIIDNVVKCHATQFNIDCKWIKLPSYVTKDYIPADAEWYSAKEDAEFLPLPEHGDNSQLKILHVNGKDKVLRGVGDEDKYYGTIYDMPKLVYVYLNSEIIARRLGYNTVVSSAQILTHCPELLTVQFGPDVKRIAQICEGDEKLFNIQLPDGLEYIGQGSFSFLPSLEKLWIPDSVDSIGLQCLANCGNLKKLYVGSGVKYIEEGFCAFIFSSDASSISDLYMAAANPPDGLPRSLTANCKIYVPIGSRELYEADSQWSMYQGQFYEIDFSTVTRNNY